MNVPYAHLSKPVGTALVHTFVCTMSYQPVAPMETRIGYTPKGIGGDPRGEAIAKIDEVCVAIGVPEEGRANLRRVIECVPASCESATMAISHVISGLGPDAQRLMRQIWEAPKDSQPPGPLAIGVRLSPDWVVEFYPHEPMGFGSSNTIWLILVHQTSCYTVPPAECWNDRVKSWLKYPLYDPFKVGKTPAR